MVGAVAGALVQRDRYWLDVVTDCDTNLKLHEPIKDPERHRLGTKILTKMKFAGELSIDVQFAVTVDASRASELAKEIQGLLSEFGLSTAVTVEMD